MPNKSSLLTEPNLTREAGGVVATRAAITAVFVLFVLLAASCTQSTPKMADIITANKALDQRYVDALLHSDLDAVMSTYVNSPNTFEIEADGTLLMGYDAIKSYYQKFFADVEIEEGGLLEQDYQAHGATVVGYGKYRVKFKSKQDGKEQEITGRYMDVRVQSDGKWQYASNMEVMVAPEMPAKQ
jgi:ketosteroid isomerase-like protein